MRSLLPSPAAVIHPCITGTVFAGSQVHISHLKIILEIQPADSSTGHYTQVRPSRANVCELPRIHSYNLWVR